MYDMLLRIKKNYCFIIRLQYHKIAIAMQFANDSYLNSLNYYDDYV